MTTHELKTWKEPFEAILSGAKTFELRKNDRDFKVGDTLRLREYDPLTDTYGRQLEVLVTYMLDSRVFGFALAVDRVLMSIRLIEPQQPTIDKIRERVSKMSDAEVTAFWQTLQQLAEEVDAEEGDSDVAER